MSTYVLHNKKRPLVFLACLEWQICCFGCFAAGLLVNGCFVLEDLCFYWLAQIIEIYNRLVIACIGRLQQEFNVYVPPRKKRHFFVCHRLLLYACAPNNRQPKVWNDWHRRHTSNTSRYSSSSRGKQLFNFLPLQTFEKTFGEFPFLQNL